MTEKRKLRRWHVVYYLRLFDHETESQVGHVVDLTTEGLKVVSQWPIPAPKRYSLWMELPRADGDTKQIHLEAESLWTHRDETDGRFHNTGFRLLDPPADTTRAIRSLVDRLKLDEE